MATAAGARRATRLSMFDRASKFVLLRMVARPNAVLVARAILSTMSPDRVAVKTLTADYGAKFARHRGVAFGLGAGFSFAKPYQAWQRGLNEHTNGLVRQYLPKGICFDHLSPARLRIVQNHLNSRPHPVLGYRTLKEVFDQMTQEERGGAIGL
ncbi:MAG: IS30 family transposase [Pseudomonadota bacterium]